jgi:outer membrane murein-binding lipoprotein Lpp
MVIALLQMVTDTSAGIPAWIPIISGLILAVLGGGGIAALIRAKPETNKLIIDAAQGAVLIQTGVLDEMKAQNAELKTQITELKAQVQELTQIQKQITYLEGINHAIVKENDILKTRIDQLDAFVKELKREIQEQAKIVNGKGSG